MAEDEPRKKPQPQQAVMASVDIHDNVPAGVPRRSAATLIAEYEDQQQTSVDQSQDEDGNPVKTIHTRPGTIVMYKPTETQGYAPRVVAASSIRLLLRQGWKEFCPDCNNYHLDKNGKHSTDPNLCKARPSVAVRVCPVCQKRIYDNLRFTEQAEDVDDPNVIKEELYEASTPETRTRITLNRHLWRVHPVQAQMMGVPVPEGFQELLREQAKA